MHYRETSLLIFLFCLLNYDLVHCAEERRVTQDGEQNCTSAACPGISIHCPATSCFEVLKCNSLSPSGYTGSGHLCVYRECTVKWRRFLATFLANVLNTLQSLAVLYLNVILQ